MKRYEISAFRLGVGKAHTHGYKREKKHMGNGARGPGGVQMKGLDKERVRVYTRTRTLRECRKQSKKNKRVYKITEKQRFVTLHKKEAYK